MKPVLEILPAELDANRCILLCEISNEGFSYAIKDDDKNTYIAVAVFQFDKGREPDDYSADLQNQLQQQSLLSGNFKKVYLTYSFGESVLIPFSLYDSQANTNVLNLVHGDLQKNVSILTDIIIESGIYNSYRVPTGLLDVLKSKFPVAVNKHQYSVLLKQVRAETDNLLVIFYLKKIVLMLNKNGRIQFINTFSYNTAADVLYILLNTCKQFEVENIPLRVSGMIEIKSQLTEEIQEYFSSVSFAPFRQDCNFSEEISRHPSHYFSYIFEVDVCE